MAWSDRVLAIRDRWLSSPRFQRWAAAFPLTRPTARRRARALFDVCAGFVYSQILFACVRLKLFDLLAEEPQSAAGIAARLSLPLDSTQRLLDAAVSLRLVEKRSAERYGLGALGAALVGNPAVGAMVEHHSLLYVDLHDPVGLLRGNAPKTELAKYWTYSAEEPAGASGRPGPDYTALMSSSQPLVASEVLDAYPIQKHRCLLDVGGGDGSFLIEASKRAQHLQLMLFDLPPVAKTAALRFEALGLGPRTRAISGNFLTDELPDGADVLSLVRVIHDHNDDAAMALLRAAYRALPAEGVLLLAEPMSGTPGAATVGDAYFGFYLLAMGRGRPRTPENLQQMLLAAGFKGTQLMRTRQPLQSRLLVAQKG
ncbi:MAG: methyltransferase [Steroidobacteraceae bacterium]|jgi:demethylspheroidene O-methyltransferase